MHARIMRTQFMLSRAYSEASMAEVKGTPFLDRILNYTISLGARNVRLALYYERVHGEGLILGDTFAA